MEHICEGCRITFTVTDLAWLSVYALAVAGFAPVFGVGVVTPSVAFLETLTTNFATLPPFGPVAPATVN